jgi:kinesin family member 1
MTDSVQVAVRLRPYIHSYEIDPKTKEPLAHVTKVVSIDQPVTIIRNPKDGKETQFTYDYSYDSFDSESKQFASQETVWKDLGMSVLDVAWEGYNVTLFAYGQTGSGKSYSMTGGSGEDEGIMPRASREIFQRIQANEDDELTYRVEVSMCEVYMEKIHDLFNPDAGGKQGLRVREHPKMGVYIEGLNAKLVTKYEDIENWMNVGIGNRTKAATEMNAVSIYCLLVLVNESLFILIKK